MSPLGIFNMVMPPESGHADNLKWIVIVIHGFSRVITRRRRQEVRNCNELVPLLLNADAWPPASLFLAKLPQRYFSVSPTVLLYYPNGQIQHSKQKYNEKLTFCIQNTAVCLHFEFEKSERSELRFSIENHPFISGLRFVNSIQLFNLTHISISLQNNNKL